MSLLSDDGSPAFERHYSLAPGQVISECGVVPRGEYTVLAATAGRDIETVVSQVDDAPAHTVCVAVGNGALRLTEGVSR